MLGRDLPSKSTQKLRSRSVSEPSLSIHGSSLSDSSFLLVQSPNGVKGNNLINFLPSITAIVTAYCKLKREGIESEHKINLKNIPLIKLLNLSIKNDQAIRDVIIELKKDEQALTHGAVKWIREQFGEVPVSPAASLEKKTVGSILLGAVQEWGVALVRIPLMVASDTIKPFLKPSDQKALVYQAISIMSGKTKAQHIVEIIDSCIQAKDCKGDESKCTELINQIKLIQNTHAPGGNNWRRHMFSRNVPFESAFSAFCENAVSFIKNVQTSELVSEGKPVSSDVPALEEELKRIKKENVHLKASLEQAEEARAEFEEEKKGYQRISLQNTELKAGLDRAVKACQELEKGKQSYQANARKRKKELKDKLDRVTNCDEHLREERNCIISESQALTQYNENSEEFFAHAIELRSSIIKCFLFFASTAGGSVSLYFLFGVGMSAWWLIALGLFIGGVYYAYDSYKERLQVQTFEDKMTTDKKEVLKQSTAIIELRLEKQEQKAGPRLLPDPVVIQSVEVKKNLAYFRELLNSQAVDGASKEDRREIYSIFQAAINNLKEGKKLTEDAVKRELNEACDKLSEKRQRKKPWFFGKTQHEQIDRAVDTLKEQVKPSQS